MRVLIEQSLQDEAAKALADHEVITFSNKDDERAAVVSLARTADSMVFRWPLKFYADETFFADCPNLKHIHKSGSGLEHDRVLDIAAATRAGVMFSNNAGLNADAVAEHAILMTLLALRPDTLTQINRMREGRWDPSPAEGVMRPRTLAGKTVGIVGLGQIGTCVASRLQAMKVGRILGHQRTRRFEHSYFVGVEWCSLYELMSQAEVIILCLPLNAATTGLISAELIASIQAGAVVVNVGRGGVVDEAALYDAVKSGQIGAVGLDVLEVEPSDSPLMQLPNAFVTPHTAGTSVEQQLMQRQEAIAAARDFASGKRPPRLVNGDVLSSSELRADWLRTV